MAVLPLTATAVIPTPGKSCTTDIAAPQQFLSVETVVSALIKAVRRLPLALRRSLTWDRGAELANHAQFTIATDVQVLFL